MCKNTILIIATLIIGVSFSQPIVINEFLASNVTDNPEMYDFDDYTDWIELRNLGSTARNLEGYFITDDLHNPLKWKIPDGTLIEAGGYLVIWADDFDENPGKLYTRPYWPWSEFTTQHYHTNFKLSKSGEQLGLFIADSDDDLVIIDKDVIWKYLDDGTNQESNWIQDDFNDDSWSFGHAELGYGDGDETTIVEYGSDEDNKYITTYFRKTFDVNDIEEIQSLTLSLLRDDGAVVYLNGDEVFRDNMPDGVIIYDTYATSSVISDEEDEFFTWSLSSDLLQAGQNIIAVEIHQVSSSSSDISFNLELIGKRYSNMLLIDSLTFENQITDVSYGRIIDDNSWSFFGEPTPGLPNITQSVDIFEFSGIVELSLEAGFYNGPQTIELTSGVDNEPIYYTLDGSKPGTQSLLYTNPINIDTTTVLKARAIGHNKISGEIILSTYFISEQNFLPTISLVAEPRLLWDADIGIYENEYKQREIPVTLQYFTHEAENGFTSNVGARLGGLNIWTKPQKPFTIYTRDRFGDDFINYQLFKNKQITNFSRIVLRNGGDDWEETLIRDPMTEGIISGMMDCGYMAYQPSSLFLNGDYWGIYNIREKFDINYFRENFNINSNNIDHLEYTTTISGTQLQVVEGNLDYYNSMIDYIVNNDINNINIYTQIKELMNVDSFIDHVVMTLFCANTSWGHNREWWRPHQENEKWQWLIVDVDRGFNPSNISTNLLDDLMADYELFQLLLNSQFFQNRFVQRAASHLSNTFIPDRINTIVDSLSGIIFNEMPRHINRWGNQDGIYSMDNWEDNLDEIKQFSQERNNIVLNQIINELDLDGTVQVIVNVQPVGSGKILINDVPLINQDGAGSYFKDNPISIAAYSLPGYEFVGWQGNSDSTIIHYDCIFDSSFTALFQSSDEIILPEVLTQNTLLTNNQPYVISQNLIISSETSLTIEEGVEIRMLEGSNIIVEGQLIIEGTEDAPVQIIPHASIGENRWGSICINNGSELSNISHLKLSGASRGANPMIHKGAISSINSDIVLNNLEITDVLFPIYVEGGTIILNNSSISCEYISDYINVKGGDAIIENCVFFGSDADDTDAIDLDNVTNGIIRNNRIYNFTGSNSDGIDIGESSQEILISSNLIYHIEDKGISIGQESSMIVEKNLIVGSGKGIAVKDNSSAFIINNTFYSNDTSVSCFEKNEGAGGGNAEIVNSIFSNNLSFSTFEDEFSSISVRYSLSDSELIDGEGNLFSNPYFLDQTIYNLELASDSPCIDAGDPNHSIDEDGSNTDIGAYYDFNDHDYPFEIPNQLIFQLKINELLASNNETNVDEVGEYDDWVELFNPSNQALNLSGLFLSDGTNQWEFPDSLDFILPGDFILVWCDNNENQGPLHTNFRLSANGEELILLNTDASTVIDSISFGPQLTDQSYGRSIDGGNEWTNMTPSPGYSNSELSQGNNSILPNRYYISQNYPNPFNPKTTFYYEIPQDEFVTIRVYDMIGREVKKIYSGHQKAGYRIIDWNGMNRDGKLVSAGLYLYVFEAGKFKDTKKMLLVK